MRSISKVVLAVFLLAVTGNQTLTRGYLYTNVGTLFSWSSGAQAGWNGSSQVATCADYNTYIKNDGTTCTATATLLDSFAIAHAVNSVTHSPLVANNTFAGGLFTSWASANTGSCNGTLFNAFVVGGQSLAQADSATCTSTTAVVNLTQTFTISGTPTSQTYSYQYRGSLSSSGDADCTQGFGTASLVLKIHGSTVATTGSPVLDGAWHTVSGTTSVMANGSNAFEIDATLTGATGSSQYYNPGIGYLCRLATTKAQPIQVTNIVLSAVY